MNNYRTLFAFVFVLAQFCSQVQAQTVENRQLRSFHTVKSAGSLDVILERGNDERVQIEVRNIDPDDIITEVENGVLKIYQESRKWNWKNVSGKIYVTYRSLDAVYVSGSADVECTDRISASSFEIKCSGSGNLKLSRLEADRLSATLSGSANMYLAGSVGSQYLKISGSGNIKADDLDCDETEAHISGSGNIYAVAYDKLDARISGSGNIRYKGNAERTYAKSSGSGNISRMYD